MNLNERLNWIFTSETMGKILKDRYIVTVHVGVFWQGFDFEAGRFSCWASARLWVALYLLSNPLRICYIKPIKD